MLSPDPEGCRMFIAKGVSFVPDPKGVLCVAIGSNWTGFGVDDDGRKRNLPL